MKICRVCALYFSPTGGTKALALGCAQTLARLLEVPLEQVDLTLPEARREVRSFGPETLLAAAFPVYAGRLPNKLLPELSEKLRGADTPAVALCAFGNRSPGQAVEELTGLLEQNGFQPAGAAAYVSRHAFSHKIGAGRPDQRDFAQLEEFSVKIAEKVRSQDKLAPLPVSREPLGPYYTPLKEDGTPARFLKARPLTDPQKCRSCGLCPRVCPMGSIDRESFLAQGLCIKCQACVRKCPAGAKYFDDPDFLSHVAMLERDYKNPAKNRIIV